MAATSPPRRAASADHHLPHTVTVDGAEIRYGVSGNGDRDLVLLHGSGAHHLWWHRVVPALTDSWRIVTLDFSGHGESGHREQYDVATWADELVAVLQAAGCRRPLVAAHSMGGRIALVAADRHPADIGGLALFDTGIWMPERLRSAPPPPPPRPPRIHADREAALRRFRLLPPQPHPPDAALGPVAEHSLRRTEGGWTWRHDQRGFPLLFEDAVEEAAASVRLPVTYVWASESLIVNEILAARAAETIQDVTVVRVPGVHHHLVLEVPELCARLIDEAGSRLRVALPS